MIATVFNPAGTAPLLFICEHASNYIPAEYAGLGLNETQLQRHIAWDPGALEVAKAMALELNAPLIFANISRLVIDLNRNPLDFDAMPEISETTPIPGNIGLSNAAKAARAKTYYVPFHRAVSDFIFQKGDLQALISVHSFNPVYIATARPWHAGLITGEDETLARAMLDSLKQDSGFVGDINVPYSPSDRVYHTLERHAASNSVKTAMIEVRNDLITCEADQTAWGMRLSRSVRAALGL